jgi:hypothetical protein
VLAFAYVLPVGAALGIAAIHRRLAAGSRAWAWVASAALTVVMVAGPVWAWSHQGSFIRDDEVAPLQAAARVAAALPQDTPLVLLVENDDPHIGFLATLAGNEFRAALPPDRIDDVHLAVGTPQDFAEGKPTLRGNALHDEMSRRYLEDLRSVDRPLMAFVLEPFNARFDQAVPSGLECGPGVRLVPIPGGTPAAQVACQAPAAIGPDLQPFEPWTILLAAPLVLAALFLAGYGWSRAVLGRRTASFGLAPAFGLATLALAGFLLDQLGVRLEGIVATAVALLLPSAGGYLLALRFERDAVA